MSESPITKYREYWKKIINYQNILNCLHWDMEVMMPSKGSTERAVQITQLSSLSHKLFVSNEFDKFINDVSEYIQKANIPEKVLLEREISVLERERERVKKLPVSLVEKFTGKTSIAHKVWIEAKKNQNFQEFQTCLDEIVSLSKEMAELYGYKNERYDALLENYEVGISGEFLEGLFQDLKYSLVPIIDRAKSFPNPFSGIPIDKQKRFNQKLPSILGLPNDSYRLDTSVHPFSTSLGQYDKRITTQYFEYEPLSSVFSVLHEVGHALYEYGLSQMNDYPNPLTTSISLGIHESQSRMWENQVGRSRAFWEYFYPVLLKDFELSESDLPFDSLYNFINSTSKSKIRVEADQITYNLHIILRFEIERELISKDLKVSELADLWNAKMKDYFGLEIKNDSEGVLQDIHWSGGAFGYFPTYALGNIYAAQLFQKFINKHSDFWRTVKEEGDFSILSQWLNKHVHKKGKKFDPHELIQDITGNPPDSSYLIEYLKFKQKEVE